MFDLYQVKNALKPHTFPIFDFKKKYIPIFMASIRVIQLPMLLKYHERY